jgi:hypothetical protein
MSFKPNDRLDPEDPLYYAPPAVRSEAEPQSNSTPQTRPERLTTHPRSRFDEMLEEAVGNSVRHPLESEFVFERDESRPLLLVASRFAAVIGALAIVGVVIFILAPKILQASPPEPAAPEFRTGASAGAAKITPEETRALLQKFLGPKILQASPPEPTVSEPTVASTGATKITSEESRTLLQKLEQWRQRQ